jgi:hypothetical protein
MNGFEQDYLDFSQSIWADDRLLRSLSESFQRSIRIIQKSRLLISQSRALLASLERIGVAGVPELPAWRPPPAGAGKSP